MPHLTLATPVEQLHRVGQTIAQRLKKLGITTAEDLLRHFPSRYDDFRNITPIADAIPDTHATIRGMIELIHNKRSPRKRMIITEGLIRDTSGAIKVIWFNQPFIGKTLRPGEEIFLSGKIDGGYFGVQLTNPTYEKVQTEHIHTARIVPIYPLTEKITQKQLRFLIKQVLPMAEKMPDYLPNSIKESYGLPPLSEALSEIHFPQNHEEMNRARRRLKFDELFFIQLHSQKQRRDLSRVPSEPLLFHEKEIRDFVNGLPFTLTNDQKKAAWEILQDLQKPHPMNRLLEGDVGSGKTVVAAMAMKNVSLNSKQSVFLAPTEILAQQHFQSLIRLLPEHRIGLLTRTEHRFNQENPTRTELLQRISSSQVDIVIGTHALLEDQVQFLDLALAIIDEQHRFGVRQRKTLQEESGNRLTLPHLLSMTATPIPRSLALTLYGDLDLSIIKEKPAGRQPIQTRLVYARERPSVYAFVEKEIQQGRQIFVICPLITESDRLGVKSVEQEMIHLQEIFPQQKIRALHGRLKSEEKESIMEHFRQNDFPILVSTSVVEVGVDIPNATVMIIEDAQRFGLAQLHQFRGRVGRGTHPSYCFLFAENSTYPSEQRLRKFSQSQDGFALAEYDLQLRGPGDVYGLRQSGMPLLRFATLSDTDLITATRNAAKEYLGKDPDLSQNPQLQEGLKQFEKTLHLE